MTLKKYLQNRPQKWGKIRNLYKNPDTNRKANWLILTLETLFVIYAIHSFYACPCAYKNCGIQHYDEQGNIDWTYTTPNCTFTREYINKQNTIHLQKQNPQNYLTPQEIQNTTKWTTN